MEDNQFWDELANRLRQEKAQPFQEGDWEAVHQRIRANKRRVWWFWPLIIGLMLVANNLIWYLLWPQPAMPLAPASAAVQRDTVVLIRERVLHDTVWQQMPSQLTRSMEQSASLRPQKIAALPQPVLKTTTASATAPATAIDSQTLAASATDNTVDREEMAATPRVPTTALQTTVQSERSALLTPFSASIVPAQSIEPFAERLATRLLLTADAGGAAFLSENSSRMYLWQAGVNGYAMSGKWGGTAGLHRVGAVENPAQTGPELGWSIECPTCPASPDYPDRVTLQWTEFQMGLVYRLALPGRKTELLLSAAGQLRSPIAQYKHFRFENYGGPPVEIDHWARQPSGLYWNGWSSSLLVVHRITGNFGVSGSVQGRWTGGVNPALMPASIGLSAGLVWYVRE